MKYLLCSLSISLLVVGCGVTNPYTQYNVAMHSLPVQSTYKMAHEQGSLPEVEGETYAKIKQNNIKQTKQEPVSTFSIDVDTAAYANVRRWLNKGRLPPTDAVRVEEMINYFDYDYPLPNTRKRPFSVTTEIAPTPWNSKTKLLHIGLKGYQSEKLILPPANLVFLIDVSGSMFESLNLLKTSLKLLTKQMRVKDTLSIVVYAGHTAIMLEPTSAHNQMDINHALDRLTAKGSTNGGSGIRLAYSMAQKAFVKEGINRIILATDGDFNVGTVNFEALIDLIKEKRKSGISMTTLGFGRGNYNDQLMEQMADAGNGNYAYIDNLSEARKVLVNQIGSTLHTIAQDVKIQLEFNPEVVSEYRLIGYENRHLEQEDFDNDRVDAGEIGEGHSVTALYEVAFKGEGGESIKASRYHPEKPSQSNYHKEFGFLRLRYKLKQGDNSQLFETPLLIKSVQNNLSSSSNNFRYSAAVAGFGQLLRGGKYMKNFGYPQVKKLVETTDGKDKFGYRSEFITLVDLADTLQTSSPLSK